MIIGLLWFVIGLLPLLLIVHWASRHVDVKDYVRPYHSDAPEEPCWTEDISTDGRFNYRRYGCYHAQLAEMDARAGRGEFNTYG